MRTIDKIIVHASDQPANYPELGYAERLHDAASIKRYHVGHNGWTDIGYHWVIKGNGQIEPGRSENVMGAHVKGHNKSSIGICLVTDDDSGLIRLPQVVSLRHLVRDRLREYNLPLDSVYTHNYFTEKKRCPGFGRFDLLNLLKG